MNNEEVFGRLVQRQGVGNLKLSLAPENIRKAGVVSYCGAEFDFPTCPAFCRGVAEAALRGSFGFTLQDDAYNRRVQWWLKAVRDLVIEPDWVVPTHGTIFALATAIRLYVGKGENMIVLLPGYDRYQQASDRLGVGTVFSRLRYEEAGTVAARYALDFDDLEAKMRDPKNRLLVLCQPNNPTGTVYTRNELQRIAALSKQYGVAVFSDEIFAEISLTGQPIPSYVEAAGPDALAITCTSLGKCMSLTGVNHANVLIASPAVRERYRRQRNADHYGSIDPMLYSGLMSACTEEGAEFVRLLIALTKRNAETMTRAIEEALPGARVIRPQGTYVLWADYSGAGLDDDELETFLQNEALFYGSDGSDYGVSRQFWRYNLSVPEEALSRSMRLLRQAAARRGFSKEE